MLREQTTNCWNNMRIKCINHELFTNLLIFRGSEEDASVWKSNYMELDKEINRFCQDMSSSSKTSPKKLSTPRSGSNPVSAVQALLAETKSQVLARLKQIEEKDRWVSSIPVTPPKLKHKFLFILVEEIETLVANKFYSYIFKPNF